MPKNKKTSKVRRKKTSKKAKRQFLFRQIFGLLFVILGLIFLLAFPTLPASPAGAREPITAGKDFEKNNKESEIERILIPKINIDIKVTPSKILNGYWETSETTASHGQGSANPGQNNNTVVFAHAREGLFYNLKDIKKDDVIYLFTKDKWYRYKVAEIKTVYPSDVETILPSKNEILTLFTCSGFFDEKRLIVKALPTN